MLFCDTVALAAPEKTFAIHAVARDHDSSHVEERGNGVLALFPSATNALACAHQLRADCEDLQFGLALGEVFYTPEELIGSVVIEAARLHQLADRGQILMTDVFAHTSGAAPRGATRLEPMLLKGFDKPTLVWESSDPAGGSIELAAEAEVSPGTLQARLDVDMVNSTGLLARVGDVAASRVQARYKAAVVASAEPHGGALLLRHGDGFAFAFPTASAACEAGISLVQAVAEDNIAADVHPFDVRVAITCQAVADPGSSIPAGRLGGSDGGGHQVGLVDRAPSGQIVADDVTVAVSRDRGIVFTPAGDGASVVVAPGVALPLPHALLAADSPALVGRRSELETLRDAYRRSAKGELVVANIAGGPGMGKTSVVAAAAAEAADVGALVLLGACDPELNVPYGPVRDALIQAGEWAADLIPDIESVFGPDHDGASTRAQQPVDDREQIFERIAAVVRELARRRPLILVIDDLHWLTTSTGLALKHLAACLGTSRILLITTYRDAEIGHGHPVRHLAADLSDLGVDPIPVTPAPLGASSVAELMAHSLGAPLDKSALSLAERLSKDTGGSPFFVAEVVREMAANGSMLVEHGHVVVAGDADALPIPRTVRGAIEGRLSRLDSDVHEALTLAACAGPAFSLDVAAQALNQPIEHVVDAVEAAARLNLVQEGERARTYKFAHALVRSTLLHDLTATRTATHHEAIARSLESLPGDHLDELARHWANAAGPEAESKAIRYLLTAADRDVDALAWESAIDRYQTVLERLEANPAASDAARAEAWLGMGWARRAMGDGEFLDTMIEAGRQARRAERPDLLARAAIGGMKPGTWFNNANETNDVIVGFCEDALTGLRPDDPVRVEVLSILATSLAFEDGQQRRQALDDEAIALARRLGDPQLVASALVAEHLAMWSPATLDRRQQIADELLRIARRRDVVDLEFLARFFQTSILLETGRIDDTHAAIEELHPLIKRSGNFWFQFLVERMQIGLAIALDVSGTKSRVDALFTEAVETQADAAGTWAAQHGGIAIHERRFGDMVESLEKAAVGRLGQGIWSYALVNALIARGDYEAANDLADRLVAPNMDFMWLVTMQMLAEAGHGLERTDLCRRALDGLLPYRGRVGVVASGTLTYALVSTSIGQAAIGLGDFGLAVDCLAEAVEQGKAMASPFFEERSRELLAEARVLQAGQR